MAVQAKWIVLGVVAILVLGVGIGLVSTYNGLVREQNAVETQSGQVDVVYQRAFGLLPQLTNLAEQYMSNERQVMENVTALRSGLATAQRGNVTQQDAFLSQYQQFVLLVQGRQEAYPELKASKLFQDTLNENINSANKIAAEKGRYNEMAGAYNAHIRECCLPMLVASMFGFEKAELIRYEDRPNQTPFPTGTAPIA